MEFLRFGSTIPGTYWGCCAFDIIQNFKVDPDAKTSIQLVGGDGGNPIMIGKELAFAGPTYRDVFWQRIRFGTFDKRDMPNHGFLAILTENQVNNGYGAKWLPILKEAGFEFIRSVSNSVYEGQNLGKPSGKGSSMNHLFGLFRNIGNGSSANPLIPPAAWTKLPQVIDEAWQLMTPTDMAGFVERQHAIQTDIWNKIGEAKLLTEAEVVAAGAPVVLAGLRSPYPQQTKETRQMLKEQAAAATLSPVVQPKDPFATAVLAQPVDVHEEDCDQDYEEEYDEYDSDGRCTDESCEICYPTSDVNFA